MGIHVIRFRIFPGITGSEVQRRPRITFETSTSQWTDVVQTPRLFTTPANPLSLRCGLWTHSWTCADRGKLCGGRWRFYSKRISQRNGSAVSDTGRPPLSLTLADRYCILKMHVQPISGRSAAVYFQQIVLCLSINLCLSPGWCSAER